MLLGRHADPDSTLGTDPRSDPRMVAAFARFGLDGRLPSSGLSVDSPLEERHAYATMSEQGMGAVFNVLAAEVPAPAGVTTTTSKITGADGNDITLHISRPADVTGPLPGVVHLHGGGMAIASAADLAYIRLREHLAATGVVVVGVEFRNSSGRLGPHPYPAGLNDCASAARWASSHRAELGISHLVVSGESGGGNLTLTLAHKAKRDGWLGEISGFYAQCPFISNRWLQDCEDLPSLTENDGYFVSCEQLALLGSVYDPDGRHAQDATCWASMATDEELRGLPPHVISVNELDPLRDEGLQYYRRLLRAGVPAVGRVVAGTCHGGDLLFGGAMPDVFAASLRDVSGFAASLG
ncbi:alpha/beta hydrolase fold domain-containing protein [Mycobacterium sp. ITM-2016-00317]|uniref:alpha/beta hydrolase fold domain-containing protein n=1 Tax=Mycobacterium sp. ITM-2016-00317 TaxID=2099694 RepID=UPI00287F8DCF|nr:alpha/beta hydrolase fold domain-containing protein [Mycobacterium sp. ITM-2016-00317]WNG88443.1 alpha/beta hydrolase fold domain-containing protein [Mycobacterium sp. ITM-2016-00317]